MKNTLTFEIKNKSGEVLAKQSGQDFVHLVYENEYAEGDCIVFSVSQMLLRNSLEWKLGAIVGLEDADFCIIPGIHWQLATLLIDCNVGIFGGKKTGNFGQFSRNSFIRLTLAYEF